MFSKLIRYPQLPFHLAASLLALASIAVSAQSIQAPAGAMTPGNPNTPIDVQPGGALADIGLTGRLSKFELVPPVVTRGANDSGLEQLFEARCRSVVLVAAVKGSGKEAQVGTGTGSIVTPQGHILTAAHVIAGADKLAVGVFSTCQPGAQPEIFAVRLFKVDVASDLALLKLDAIPKDMSVMPLGNLADVRPGTPVVIIGHPRGLLMSMSQGVVSAIRPNYKWAPEGNAQMQATVIQTDGTLNPGNSGGPMMTRAGTLVGVNSFIYGQASAGLNFAVSVDDVRSFFSRTENRTSAEAAPPPRSPSAAEECKPKVLKEWKEDGLTKRSMDVGCTGRANTLLVMSEDPSVRGYLLWDRNGDGKADVKYYLSRANKPEFSEWDDDFDGTYDYRAEHENGEWEPKAKLRIASR